MLLQPVVGLVQQWLCLAEGNPQPLPTDATPEALLLLKLAHKPNMQGF